jgi:vacuolar-type H+-ATPase subunit I/STV1
MPKKVHTEVFEMNVEKLKRMRKGQIGAMGIVTLAVTIMIGLVVVGYIFDALDTSDLPTTAQTAINGTMDNAGIAMTLLGIALIVGAAVFILGIMGGAR